MSTSTVTQPEKTDWAQTVADVTHALDDARQRLIAVTTERDRLRLESFALISAIRLLLTSDALMPAVHYDRYDNPVDRCQLCELVEDHTAECPVGIAQQVLRKAEGR